MTTELPAPSLHIDPDSAAFWAATLEGRLILCRCAACEQVIWIPRPFCPRCGTWEIEYFDACGRGTVYAFTTVARGAGEYAGVSYTVAIVELHEGPRLITNIIDVSSDEIRVGMAVDVAFQRTESPAALPRFRPSGGVSIGRSEPRRPTTAG